jgi:hypothetical protein
MQHAVRSHNIIPGTPKPITPAVWFWGRPRRAMPHAVRSHNLIPGTPKPITRRSGFGTARTPPPRRQRGFESISGSPTGGALTAPPQPRRPWGPHEPRSGAPEIGPDIPYPTSDIRYKRWFGGWFQGSLNCPCGAPEPRSGAPELGPDIPYPTRYPI